MHLLAAIPGTIADGSEAVDLGQTPADVVVLSAADSDLACLAAAKQSVPGFTLRLANVMQLGHPMSVDVYVERIIGAARLVVVRLLGGRAYWPYGVEQIAIACAARNIACAFLPGDDQPDADLATENRVPPQAAHRLWQYLAQGGVDNAGQFLRFAGTLLGVAADWREPAPLPPAGLHPAGQTLDEVTAAWVPGQPVAAVVFYRALVQAGNVAAPDALVAALRAQRCNVVAIHVASLKDPVCAALVGEILAETQADVVLNATGFAVSAPGRPQDGPFAAADCPVLQVIFSGGTERAWRDGTQGLSARDIAMNVALPEVDGRIISRAVSFKAAAQRDAATECDVVAYRAVADRIDFVAELAANWARLRRKDPAQRKVALVLANYPNRDGRLANGVGLDTPAATVEVLRALAAAGYRVTDLPADAAALMAVVQAGPTNAHRALDRRAKRETLSLPDYYAFFQSLPAAVRQAVTARWGAPEADPSFRAGRLQCGDFLLPVTRFGAVAVAVQPARGYNVDPASSCHDPALVPPHGYLAFHAWMRDQFRADAVVHMGKHGNLEWLPGKAVALSSACFPEAALGPLPHLYPFIVNDPGEGTQAKRRAQAVIIDHLTPPLTRAETYGPLRQLEQLVDEYYDAAQLDPRRLPVLQREIVALLRVTGLDDDCAIAAADDPDTALKKLDTHLCELKELQIRDGLHIFGVSPTGDQRTDLLVALARAPRGPAPHDASLLRALADDLDLGFDPLDCAMADAWTGPRPGLLAGEAPWRSVGDTVERLEVCVRGMVGGLEARGCRPDPARGDAPNPLIFYNNGVGSHDGLTLPAPVEKNQRGFGASPRAGEGRQPQRASASLPRTTAVLDWIAQTLMPTIDGCGPAELDGLLRGLAGRFVAPGPSGAPTRGRPEVLPTGRNFYSVDTRVVPTPAAWHLGWKSATLLLERHAQDHGAWPQAIAVTAWGTSNMRTGGDDIAQALALMGVRPTWDTASRRVTGFEILPLSVLDRPRVDVTLRVSGFFRDAFPALIDLVDSAARAVAALTDEPAEMNPLASRVAAETTRLEAEGLAAPEARRRAGHRVFGSKPGAYGAGLQALMDEGCWQTEADLAAAYVAWGGYAYGAGADGAAAHDLFQARLTRIDAVVQNQDNREHDLLDSDDYYQFEGGMTAAVRTLSGAQPVVYHPDHSRPETPRINTLDEEIARIVRGRAANPKWIAGVMRHGYKGAFEMAATVDYLFAFAATARVVKNHHFDQVFDAYLGTEAVRDFIAANNPAALAEMQDKFRDAIARGLWRPRRNDVFEVMGGER